MNEFIPHELKIVVERAVRPVPASAARKRRMREELLTHLMAIYNDELESRGDPQEALERTKRRFGDAGELSVQLRGSLPWWSRAVGACQKLVEIRAGESVLHYALRITLCMFAAQMVVLPLVLFTARGGEAWLAVRLVMVMLTASAAFGFVFLVLAYQIARALHGRSSERSWAMAIIYAVGSLAVLPCLAFLAYWAAGGDFQGALSHFRYALYFAPAMPIVLVLMSRQMADELHDAEEWASLEIEG